MTASIPDLVGMVGAAVIVAAYLLLQTDRLESRSLAFSLANSIGAAGILFSLLDAFNLSAFVIELFWLAISLFGVYRAMRSRGAEADG